MGFGDFDQYYLFNLIIWTKDLANHTYVVSQRRNGFSYMESLKVEQYLGNIKKLITFELSSRRFG